MSIKLKGISSPTVVQSKLLGLAKRDLHWADKLLNSSMMLNNASYVDVLKIAAAHPSIISALLTNQDARQSLTPRDLTILCCQAESVALEILNDSNLRELLQSSHLAQIAQSDIKLATFIFKTPLLRDKLEGSDLALVGSVSEDIASQILAVPQLRMRLCHQDFAVLCKNHPRLAQQLVDEDVLDGFEDEDLCHFAQYHPTIANQILQSSDLRGRLKSETLYQLGQTHEQIAMQIFSDNELMTLSEPKAWAQWAAKHHGFAQALLKSTTYHTLLDGHGLVQIAQKNPELALFFYSQAQFNEAYRDKLQANHLCQLGQTNSKVAHAILDDKTFAASLNGAQLSVLAFKHPDVAKRVLTHKGHAAKLEGNHLAKICLAGPDIVAFVFRQKSMVNQIIEAGKLAAVCEKYIGVLSKVSQNTDMTSRVPPNQVAVIQAHKLIFDAVAKLIVELNNKPVDKDKENIAKDIPKQALTPLYKKDNQHKEPNSESKQMMKRRVILH